FSYSYFTLSLFFFLMLLPPPRSTLFPYTTLFRSPELRPESDLNRTSQNLPTLNVRAARRNRLPARKFFLNQPVQVSHDGWLVKADRKSTRLNSSHVAISYAVFCLKKKTKNKKQKN